MYIIVMVFNDGSADRYCGPFKTEKEAREHFASTPNPRTFKWHIEPLSVPKSWRQT
jgi:hypothetical protein